MQFLRTTHDPLGFSGAGAQLVGSDEVLRDAYVLQEFTTADGATHVIAAVATAGEAPDATQAEQALNELVERYSEDAQNFQYELPEALTGLAAVIISGGMATFLSLGTASVFRLRQGSWEEIAGEQQGNIEPTDRYFVASQGVNILSTAGNMNLEQLALHPQLIYAESADVTNTILRIVRDTEAPDKPCSSLIVLNIESTQDSHEHQSAKYHIAGANRTGDRNNQQDSDICLVEGECVLAVVADGAGGHHGGKQASQIAVNCFQQLWESDLKQGVSIEEASKLLTQQLALANEKIITDSGGGKVSLSGKSAIVALYINGEEYVAINAGDCRAYHYSHAQGEWKQISKDDSLLQLLLDSGEVTPEKAENHPDQNTLLQALGASCRLRPHLFPGTCTGDDTFMLSCDGFWNQFRPAAEWQKELTDYSIEPDSRRAHLEALAKTAHERAQGKSDNISVIWVSPLATPPEIVPEAPVEEEPGSAELPQEAHDEHEQQSANSQLLTPLSIAVIALAVGAICYFSTLCSQNKQPADIPSAAQTAEPAQELAPEPVPSPAPDFQTNTQPFRH